MRIETRIIGVCIILLFISTLRGLTEYVRGYHISDNKVLIQNWPMQLKSSVI